MVDGPLLGQEEDEPVCVRRLAPATLREIVGGVLVAAVHHHDQWRGVAQRVGQVGEHLERAGI